MAKRIGGAEFEEQVLKADRPVLVDFYSDSCIVCKKLSPALSQVEDALEGQYYFYKVNTDFEEALTEKYEILSRPTLLVFHAGRELGRKAGVQKPEELTQWLKSFLDMKWKTKKERKMVITVAGNRKEVKTGLKLSELMEQEQVEMPEYVTVSVNDEFVETDARSATVLKEGDQVEFLYFMGGGC